MNDLISVIVPIYNVAKYLSQCINSIINQTYTNLEIILIDDGSTDNCLEIMREYEKNDTRIKCYTRENKGLLYTRIDGVNKSHGQYVIFVDSDDWLELNTIEILYNKMIKYSADMVKCSYSMVFENKSIDIIRKQSDTIYEKESLNEIYDELVNNYIFHSAWSQLIKSEIIKENVNTCDYSISMGEDIELNIHLLDKYKKIVVTSDILYNYRSNCNSISNATSYEKVKNRVTDLMKVYINFTGFIKEKSNKNYKKALNKSITDINDKLLDFANINHLKLNYIDEFVKNVFNDSFMEKIRKNLTYDEINNKDIFRKYFFVRNMYLNNYKLYLFNLSIASKYRKIKRIVKKVIKK